MAAARLQEISKDENERALLLAQKKFEMDLFTYHDDAREAVETRVNEKWQTVVAEKDAELERLRLEIAELKATHSNQ